MKTSVMTAGKGKKCPACCAPVGWERCGTWGTWNCRKCGTVLHFQRNRRWLGTFASAAFIFLGFILAGLAFGHVYWWYIFLIGGIGAGLVHCLDVIEAKDVA